MDSSHMQLTARALLGGPGVVRSELLSVMPFHPWVCGILHASAYHGCCFGTRRGVWPFVPKDCSGWQTKDLYLLFTWGPLAAYRPHTWSPLVLERDWWCSAPLCCPGRKPASAQWCQMQRVMTTKTGGPALVGGGGGVRPHRTPHLPCLLPAKGRFPWTLVLAPAGLHFRGQHHLRVNRHLPSCWEGHGDGRSQAGSGLCSALLPLA